MQQPFMKLFSTSKHGQVLVMVNDLELSITWKREDGILFVNTLPGFKNHNEIQGAFETIDRESVESMVNNVKFLDEDVKEVIQ